MLIKGPPVVWKSRNPEIWVLSWPKFDSHLDSHVAEAPVKIESDETILTANLAPPRFHEVSWEDSILLNK